MSNANNSTANNAPTSKLAIASLVLSLLCCWPIALGLGIAALIKIEGSKGALGGKTLAIVALVLSGLAVPGAGVMAAIAVPNFVKFQCRSKQAEAKGNLKALYVAEMSYAAEHDEYAADFATIGFQPNGATIRYDYRVVSAGKGAFVAEAIGKNEMAGDIWRITEANSLEHVDDVCSK